MLSLLIENFPPVTSHLIQLIALFSNIFLHFHLNICCAAKMLTLFHPPAVDFFFLFAIAIFAILSCYPYK